MATTNDINGFSRERELAALVNLTRELVKYRLQVGFSDARPAVSVCGGQTPAKVWVEIDASRKAFVWGRGDRDRHAMNDPVGAAIRLADHVRARGSGPGDRP